MKLDFNVYTTSKQMSAGPKVEVLQWNTVLIVDQNVNKDQCSICKQALGLPCPECEDVLNPVCYVVRGVCQHQYHRHCIDHWLETQNVCPMCHQAWQVEKQL